MVMTANTLTATDDMQTADFSVQEKSGYLCGQAFGARLGKSLSHFASVVQSSASHEYCGAVQLDTSYYSTVDSGLIATNGNGLFSGKFVGNHITKAFYNPTLQTVIALDSTLHQAIFYDLQSNVTKTTSATDIAVVNPHLFVAKDNKVYVFDFVLSAPDFSQNVDITFNGNVHALAEKEKLYIFADSLYALTDDSDLSELKLQKYFSIPVPQGAVAVGNKFYYISNGLKALSQSALQNYYSYSNGSCVVIGNVLAVFTTDGTSTTADFYDTTTNNLISTLQTNFAFDVATKLNNNFILISNGKLYSILQNGKSFWTATAFNSKQLKKSTAFYIKGKNIAVTISSENESKSITLNGNVDGTYQAEVYGHYLNVKIDLSQDSVVQKFTLFAQKFNTEEV